MDKVRFPTVQVLSDPADCNPAYVLRHALNARAERIARNFAQQAIDGATGNGLRSAMLITLVSDGYVDLREALVDAVAAAPPYALPPVEFARYARAVACLCRPGVEQIAEGRDGAAQALLFETRAACLLRHPELACALHGPLALLVGCHSDAELLELAVLLNGQLVVRLVSEQLDAAVAKLLVDIVQRDGA